MIRGFSFINRDYDRVGRNWTLFFERSKSNLHFSIHPYENYSSEIDTRYVGQLIGTNSDLSILWTSRVKHVLHLLEEGYDVLHSDLDAIWIKDPLPEITSLDADIVFSQGTIFPHKMVRNFGFVLCCGFFFIKSSAKTIQFVREWVRLSEIYKDDQVAINEIIQSIALKPKDKCQNILSFRNHEFMVWEKPIVIPNDANIKISLLSHNSVRRLVECIDSKIIVAHPLSGKTGVETEKCLRDLALWILQ